MNLGHFQLVKEATGMQEVGVIELVTLIRKPQLFDDTMTVFNASCVPCLALVPNSEYIDPLGERLGALQGNVSGVPLSDGQFL